MLRVLLLLLIGMGTVVFAQVEDAPQPRMFDEFEKATNGNVKMRTDGFFVELTNNPSSQGYIINYGTDREIIIREKQVKTAISWRKYDFSRVTFVRGGDCLPLKTEFWIVPPGAEPPPPNCENKESRLRNGEAYRFAEFGKINEKFITEQFE